MINKAKILKDAQKFVAKAQWDKAIAEYNKILAESPNDANTHNTVGDLYLKKNEIENAIESYKKAAEIFNKSGFTLKAIALYKKVLNIKPEQVDILLLMGRLNADRGMLGNANESYLAAASYFSRQGQRGKALEVYKTLCDLNPENLSLGQKLAELYVSEGFQREGISKFIELSEKMALQGNTMEARELLEKVESSASGRFDFMRVAAVLDLKENRLPEAAKRLEEARSIDPSDTRILSLLAETYLRSGRYEESAESYRSLLDKEPANKGYRKQLIHIFVKSGDYTNAWQEYRMLVETHISMSEFDDAEALVKEYLGHKHDSIEAKQVLADIYSKTGNESGITALHKEMADLYAASGEKDKALNIYKKLLEKEPENEEIKARLSALEAEAPEKRAPEFTHKEEPLQFAPPSPPEESFEEMAIPGEKEEEAGLEEEVPFEFGPEMDAGTMDAAAEEEPSGLPEMPGEFPPMDLSEEAQGPFPGGPEPAERPEGLPDLDLEGLEGLDIFDTGEPQEKESEPVGQEISIISATGMPDIGGIEDLVGEGAEDVATEGPEPPAIEPPRPAKDISYPSIKSTASLEELLTEVDVYIKYGFIPKAKAALESLEISRPSNPEIKKKHIEISKAQGDIEGFVNASIGLADIYEKSGLPAEAEKVLRKAFGIAPHDERLKARLETPVKAEEEPGMQPGSVQYLEELAEADFYAQQGLVEEARKLYLHMIESNPGNGEIKSRLEALEGKTEELVVLETAKPPVIELEEEPALDEELDEAFKEMDFSEEAGEPEPPLAQAAEKAGTREPEFFDLGAELRQEMDYESIAGMERPSETFEDKHLEDVFQEFKRGVEEQLGKEDYETHYNLGIAYKEMGMLDEAVSEFMLAGRDASRGLDCASMLGLCFMEKGDYEKAVEQLKKGLGCAGRDKGEYMGIKYDLATVYELMGDLQSAYAVVNEMFIENENFRDVKDRLQRLGNALKEAGMTPAKREEPSEKKDGPKTTPKKSKVSYL